MKNRFLILFVVAATLFACSGDSMISDDFNETANKKDKSFPFKVVKLAGTYEFGPNVSNSLKCDAPNTSLNAIGVGIIPHLGKTSIDEQWCWLFPSALVGDRIVTFTAANGDELRGIITRIQYPEAPANFNIFIEDVTIIGGSGRFENACGSIIQTVVTSPENETSNSADGTFTYSAEGTITYNCPEED